MSYKIFIYGFVSWLEKLCFSWVGSMLLVWLMYSPSHTGASEKEVASWGMLFS